MRKKRADSTPEEWEAYKKYQRDWLEAHPKARRVASSRAIEWNRSNAERRLQIARNHHYKSKYGLTLDEVRAIWESQGGRCKLCLVVPKHVPNVDHCHVSGKVRGLVCSPCNTVVGHIENHPGLLDALGSYLVE